MAATPPTQTPTGTPTGQTPHSQTDSEGSEPTAQVAAENAPVASTPEPSEDESPEKRSLWKRFAVIGGRRSAQVGMVDKLELLAARLEVVEEQLRELGVALDRGGEVANKTATELTDRIANEMGRIERRLATIEDSGGFKQLELGVDRRLTKLEERTSSGLERVEQKLTEVWEIEEQVAQLPEVLDRLADLRDAQIELRSVVRGLSRGLTIVGLLAGASLVAWGVSTFLPMLSL